ncbi:MAG: ferric reductase-like transmembrane domain-containing protein [Pseudomonadota bacterium]
MIAPLALSVGSPLLAWREPIYIASGFAGIVGLSLLLLQPLLAAGLLPGTSVRQGRLAHRVVGGMLVLSVIIHVLGLWVTSPPDVIDVLLLRSPTPFSVWGVAAMWAVFGTTVLAALRKPLRMRWRSWRIGHSLLAVVIVVGSVVHAVLIEGTMEIMSKVALCALVLLASLWVLADRKVLARLRK